MQLNIISYIVKNTDYSQIDIAKECNVKAPTVSGWKKGAKILPKHKKKLFRMANLSISEDESTKWAILNKDKDDPEEWYEYMSCHLQCKTDLYNQIDQYSFKLNPDSFWIEKIQRMIITAHEAGVPLTAEKTFPPIVMPGPDGEKYYSDFDELMLRFAKAYMILREWGLKYIAPVKLDGDGLKIQHNLAKSIVALALHRVPKRLFEATNTPTDILSTHSKKTTETINQQINDFCEAAKKSGVTIAIDYFDLVNKGLDTLRMQTQEGRPSDQYLSYETKIILEGIKNNENLLKEVLKRLDGDASY